MNKNDNPENVPAAEQPPAASEQATPPPPPSAQPDPAAHTSGIPDPAAPASGIPGPATPPPVSRNGGFATFVRNRGVQLAGASLVGIFIGGGAVATGVAVADNDREPRWADRSGFSREWQSPGDQSNPFDGMQRPGQPNQNQDQGDSGNVDPGTPITPS